MDHDDFATEPVHGLAKQLPPGERILWQGAPRPWALAVESMALRWVIGYFALLAAWRGLAIGGTEGPAAGASAVLFYVVIGGVASGLILGAAWVFARTTVYTITSARVVLRIGAALTISLNLPYRYIASADLAKGRGDTGSIHLDLRGTSKVSYLVLWPHVRPWMMSRPQPTLRAIPDVETVARILGRAAASEVAEISATVPPASPQAMPAGAAVPAE